MFDLTTEIASIFFDEFREKVIHKCHQARSENFFYTLLEEVNLEMELSKEEKSLDTVLDKILSNDRNSSFLFEIYRKISLGASKTLGPRILALITANIVNKDRLANKKEEVFLSLIEELNDQELIQISLFLSDNESCIGSKKQLYKDCFDRDTGGTRVLGPPHLSTELGVWATKLQKFGLLSAYTQQREEAYMEDSERYIDHDGVTLIHEHYLEFDQSLKSLLKLINRAKGPKA